MQGESAPGTVPPAAQGPAGAHEWAQWEAWRQQQEQMQPQSSQQQHYAVQLLRLADSSLLMTQAFREQLVSFPTGATSEMPSLH